MARISNKEWLECLESKSTRGTAREVSKDDLKEMAYDTLYELCSAWCNEFGLNLRNAVYEKRYRTAKRMLECKTGEAKDRALTVIRDLERMEKED